MKKQNFRKNLDFSNTQKANKYSTFTQTILACTESFRKVLHFIFIVKKEYYIKLSNFLQLCFSKTTKGCRNPEIYILHINIPVLNPIHL